MRERMINDAQLIGADKVLYREYDGTSYQYFGHIVVAYFLVGDKEIAHYSPSDLAGLYMGKGYPQLRKYSRRWGRETMLAYKIINIESN